MTIVAAAITKQDGVVISVDSQISWDSGKSDEGPSKIWVDKERRYLFASCGDIRASQVLQYWTEWPEFRDFHKENIEKFVVKDVIPAVRYALEENGALETSKKIDTFAAGLIMAWDNNLVVIDGDFSVTVPVSGRWAIGSGANEAFGSLGDTGPWTKTDVVKAAKVASKTALGVGGDIYYASTKSLEIFKA